MLKNIIKFLESTWYFAYLAIGLWYGPKIVSKLTIVFPDSRPIIVSIVYTIYLAVFVLIEGYLSWKNKAVEGSNVIRSTIEEVRDLLPWFFVWISLFICFLVLPVNHLTFFGGGKKDWHVFMRHAYTFSEPDHGELIQYRIDQGTGTGVLLGLPGDVLTQRKGRISINDKLVVQPPVRVPKNQNTVGRIILDNYLVMVPWGPEEARFTRLKRVQILGRSVLCIYPFENAGIVQPIPLFGEKSVPPPSSKDDNPSSIIDETGTRQRIAEEENPERVLDGVEAKSTFQRWLFFALAFIVGLFLVIIENYGDASSWFIGIFPYHLFVNEPFVYDNPVVLSIFWGGPALAITLLLITKGDDRVVYSVLILFVPYLPFILLHLALVPLYKKLSLAFQNGGQTHLERNQFDTARHRFSLAVGFNNENWTALGGKAKCLMAMGNHRKAFELLKSKQENGLLQGLYFQCLVALGHYSDAIAHYQEASETETSYPFPEKNELEQAQATGLCEAIEARIDSYLEEGEQEKALSIYPLLLELDPDDLDKRMKYAALFFRSGDEEKGKRNIRDIAKFVMQKALENIDQPQAHHFMGHLALLSGETEKAHEHYLKSLRQMDDVSRFLRESLDSYQLLFGDSEIGMKEFLTVLEEVGVDYLSSSEPSGPAEE